MENKCLYFVAGRCKHPQRKNKIACRLLISKDCDNYSEAKKGKNDKKTIG